MGRENLAPLRPFPPLVCPEADDLSHFRNLKNHGLMRTRPEGRTLSPTSAAIVPGLHDEAWSYSVAWLEREVARWPTAEVA